MKLSKTPIALAIMFAISGIACAQAPITTQEQIGQIQWTGSETTLTFDSDGFQLSSSPFLVVGNEGKLTVSGTGSMIDQSDAVFTVRGLKELSLSSTNENDQATVSMKAGQFGPNNLYVGHVNPSNLNSNYENSAEYLDKLTISAQNGRAFEITYGNDNWNKSDVRIFALDTTIESKKDTALYVGGNPEDVLNAWNDEENLGSGHSDFAIEDLETADAAVNEAYNSSRTILLKSPTYSLVAENGGGFIVEGNGGRIDFEGSVKVNNGSWLELGWSAINNDLFPEEYIEPDVTEEDFEPRFLDTITISGTEADAALKVTNGSEVLMAANYVNIKGYRGKKAVELTSEAGNEQLPTVVDIYAQDTLVIDGDIEVNLQNEQDSKGYLFIGAGQNVMITGNVHTVNNTMTDNRVYLNLEGSESYLRGTINDEIVDQPATFSLMRASVKAADQTKGTILTLSNNATWQSTGASSVTEVYSTNGNIVADEAVAIDTLVNNGTTNVQVSKAEAGLVSINNNQGTGLTLTLTDQSSLTGDTAEEKTEALKNVLDVAQSDSNYTVEALESEAGDGIFVDMDKDGNEITSGTMSNTVTQSLGDIAAVQMLAWRSQINDVSKRLGDLRTYDGNAGAWARVYGSKSDYEDLDFKQTTVQVGTDAKVFDNFYVGLTASYTDGEGDISNGSSDNKAYAFGIYGGWMADNGQFIDVILKQSKMDTDFDLHYTNGNKSTGSYDMWGTSIAVEYGWRINCPATSFWLEPQVEFSYGHLQSASYTTSAGVKGNQDSIDSMVGRLGVAMGKNFDMGSAYLKASVAHDWDGESKVKMTKGNQFSQVTEDLGGTWGEFAIGGTVNFTNNFSAYGEFQTSVGSPVDTPYMWNIGARYVF